MKSLVINNKVFFVSSIILLAAISRLLPHPPNFAPIAAIALFGGDYLKDKKLAFIIPLVCMLFSDLLLHGVYLTGLSPFKGLHSMMPFVYGAFFLMVLMGQWLKQKLTVTNTIMVSLVGSILFFIVSNFGVWLMGGFYPKTPLGLVACYESAIPFFHYTLIGDLFYVGALFGTYQLASKYYPQLNLQS